MADIQNGAPPPNSVGAQGTAADTPSVAHSQPAQKRNNRHRKNNSHSIPQMDGTVSDSVTIPRASPRSKNTPKPRQQSAAMAVPPNENTNMSKANGHKPRHASLAGNMFPATPLKEQAYAGPTFHASPAPSSLPVPKFFSRSVPNVAAHQSLEARMAGEKKQEAGQSSPESDNATPPPRNTQQSPLDIFFNADRAEREKRNSGSLLSPEMAARPPPTTEPRNPFQQSGKGIFLRELDGDDGPMISPKSLPPNNRPSPPHRASSSPGVRNPETDSESERDAYTKNLKDLLLNNVNGTPPPNPTPYTNQRPHTSARPVENVFETPSPFQRSASGPSTPTPSTDQQTHYSLHYGNRNLSPLFKAARSETPPRPSSLRQELANDANASGYRPPPPPHPVPQIIDPNTFSRTYLDHTIRHNSQPALPPNVPVNVHQQHNSPSNSSNTSNTSNSGYPSVPSTQHLHSGVPTSGASPRGATTNGMASGGGGNANDVKTMEEDLRRMLKLNVLSG